MESAKGQTLLEFMDEQKLITTFSLFLKTISLVY
jgi:hypothetical protein